MARPFTPRRGGPFTKPLAVGPHHRKIWPGGGPTLICMSGTWPADGKILLPGMIQAPRSGRLLANGAPVTWTLTAEGLSVTLPGSAPDPDVSVAALEFAAPLKPASAVALPADTGGSGTLANPGDRPQAK